MNVDKSLHYNKKDNNCVSSKLVKSSYYFKIHFSFCKSLGGLVKTTMSNT